MSLVERNRELLSPGPGNSIRIVAAPHPFSTERLDAIWPAGGTVADILRALNIYPPASCNAHVFIGDVRILREYWEVVKPKPGQLLVVRIVPKGSSSGKNVLGIVIGIAAMAAGAFLGGAIAVGAFGAAAGLAGQAFGAIVGNFVGSLITRSLIPPPKSKSMASLDVGVETSPTLRGIGNRVNLLALSLGSMAGFKCFPLKVFYDSLRNSQNDTSRSSLHSCSRSRWTHSTASGGRTSQ